MCCWWKHNYATASWKSLNNGVTQKRLIVVLTRKKQPIPRRTAGALARACWTHRQPPWKLPHSRLQFVSVSKLRASNLTKVHPLLLLLGQHAFPPSALCIMCHSKHTEDAKKHRCRKAKGEWLWNGGLIILFPAASRNSFLDTNKYYS